MTNNNSIDDIQRQIEKATSLKSKILEYLDSHPDLSDEKLFQSSSPDHVIRRRLHFLDESFELITEKCSISNIDRLQSMYCGPLFTSEKHPQPKNANGDFLIPILQLDLGWIGSETRKLVGEGLLQLWFNLGDKDRNFKRFNGYIRVVPKADLACDALLSFDISKIKEIVADSYLIPEDWHFPREDSIRQVVGIRPIGMSLPNISNHLYIDDFDLDLHPDLLEAIDDLETISPVSGTHLFGGFRSIQECVEDFYPRLCFMEINNWGDGNAQIFYETANNHGSPVFSFSHCPR